MTTPKQRQAEFSAYHRQNPHVYRLFTRFALQAIRSGRKNFSARAVAHRVRWETLIKTTDPEGFKFNNNYVSFYSRKFMNDNPEYDGFFRTRASLADDPVFHIPKQKVKGG